MGNRKKKSGVFKGDMHTGSTRIRGIFDMIALVVYRKSIKGQTGDAIYFFFNFAHSLQYRSI